MNHEFDFRLAFFHRGEIWGGAEESLVTIAQDLRDRGTAVRVICLEARRVADRYEEMGLAVERTLPPREDFPRRGFRRRVHDSLECRSKGWNTGLGRWLTEWVTRRELAAVGQALGRVKPDVFFGNMSAGNDFQFLGLASRLGVATVSLQQIAPPAFAGRRLSREVSEFCDFFVSNSAWTRERWVERGLRRDRHDVIYYRIFTGEPARELLRDRLSLPGGCRLLASVGRLSAEKRFEDGIRAFAAVARECADWHYVIVGGGPERARLEREIAARGLAGRVHLVGELRDAAAYLGQVDALLHPTPGEHFGRVVAEAMLRGAIAVGHDSGGVPEMVQDGRTGFLFTDFESLVERLRLVMVEGPREAMRERARRRILDMCGPATSERLARAVAGVVRRQAAAASALGA